MDFFISIQREKQGLRPRTPVQTPVQPQGGRGRSPRRTPLHPTTELSHASTELCDILAWRHLSPPLTPYVHIYPLYRQTGNR